MPHHKSSKKRVLTAAKSALKNQQVKSRIKTASKKVRLAVSVETAVANLSKAYSELDKAVKFGVIHANKAANQKSKLAIAATKAAAATK